MNKVQNFDQNHGSVILIRWIVIYPVDTAIQLLNNWGLINKFRDFRTRPLLRGGGQGFPCGGNKRAVQPKGLPSRSIRCLLIHNNYTQILARALAKGLVIHTLLIILKNSKFFRKITFHHLSSLI